MEYKSTSTLSNELDLKSSELFDKFKALGWIQRANDKWILTDSGKLKGGQTRTSAKFGEYIVWPEDISIEQGPNSKLLNATAIGKHFEISSRRLNLILSELTWIEKDIAGWKITKLGKALGGRQFEHDTSGGTYVLWPDSILINENLTSVFNEVPTLPAQPNPQAGKNSPITKTPISEGSFRDKFPPTLRTRDGHVVRSRAEVIIDNALYEYKLVHAYERKLPIEENLYSDFFIPTENVYIEFWGMEDEPKYVERKKAKLEIYKKYDFKLIELDNSDIANLDDHLPKKLLKFGIKVY